MRKIVRRVVKPPQPATAPPPSVPPSAPPSAPPPPAEWTESEIALPRSKRLISLRLDADIVDYFQQGGRGYQTRMNAVLRAWIEARKRRHS